MICKFFPGQGFQKVGMTSYKNKLYYELLDSKLINILENGPQEQLNLTQNAQPIIFVHSYLTHLQYPKYKANYSIGHSVGEYTALAVNGFLQPDQAVRILRKRGELMARCSEGKDVGMLAINKFIERDDIACYNSNKQVVISGEIEKLKQIQANLKSQRIRSMLLQVSCAFHCSLLTPAKQEFREFLEKEFSNNKEQLSQECKVIANYNSKIYQNKKQVIEGLVEQFDKPVLFKQSVESVINENSCDSVQFIEFGSKVLAGLVKDSIRESNVISVM